MLPTRRLVSAILTGSVILTPALNAQRNDSLPKPVWRDSVRYGSGPSVGAPPSDFTGDKPPASWCLKASGRPTGDFGMTGQNWMDVSRSWLHQVLSDTTEWGSGWRKVLGGAPLLAADDSIADMHNEAECREIARIINRDILGWTVGPPPVVVFHVRDYLIAYPSNANWGEFGIAVGMSRRQRSIRGVSTW